MRGLEYLMELYPNATAKVILEIQKQDKLDDEKEFIKLNKKKLDYMEDLNKNGGYFRGRFGTDQHYLYRVYDLEMDETGRVIMKVECLVMFYNEGDKPHQVTRPGEMSFERRIKDFEYLDNYGLQDRERVTVKEWDEVNDYVNAMSKLFWGNCNKVE
jgi:hypothetical protein